MLNSKNENAIQNYNSGKSAPLVTADNPYFCLADLCLNFKMYQQLTAGKTAEEEKRRADLVRKAFDENRMISFLWYGDGSGCEFYYKGIDHHGLPCTFLSSLNVAYSIYVFSGKRVELQKGGAK